VAPGCGGAARRQVRSAPPTWSIKSQCKWGWSCSRMTKRGMQWIVAGSGRVADPAAHRRDAAVRLPQEGDYLRHHIDPTQLALQHGQRGRQHQVVAEQHL